MIKDYKQTVNTETLIRKIWAKQNVKSKQN